MGVPCTAAHISSYPPPFPQLRHVSPPPKPHPLSPHSDPSERLSAPVHQTGVRPLCASPAHRYITIDMFTFMLHHQPPPPVASHSPVPPHNITSPAHIVRRANRFPFFRFARTLPASLAYTHRIPFIISSRPEPQAPARCACRGGCDLMIAFSTVRQFMRAS